MPVPSPLQWILELVKRCLQASLLMQCHSGKTPASLYTVRCGTPLGSPRASRRAVHSTAASLCIWARGRLKRARDPNRSLFRTRRTKVFLSCSQDLRRTARRRFSAFLALAMAWSTCFVQWPLHWKVTPR